MRLLYIAESLTIHDRRYLTSLGASGHEIFFLPLYPGRSADTDALPAGVTLVSLSGTYLPFSDDQFAEVARVARTVGADIVQAGPLTSSAYVAVNAGLKPLVGMSFAYDVLWESRRNIAALRRATVALNGSDALLCDCLTAEQAAFRISPKPARHVVRFPWGIDLHHFRRTDSVAVVRQSLGWDQNIVVVTNRSWEPLYQVPLAVQSFAIAHSVMPELRLILAGSGSEAGLVQNEIDAHGVRDFVHLTGRISQTDLPGYLNASDIYLSCSLTDGASISLLEAMGCGLPVVVSDIPSNREWVVPGAEGYLSGVTSAASFAASLQSLAKIGVEGRCAIGQRGRAVVEDKADWNKNFQALLDLYGILWR